MQRWETLPCCFEKEKTIKQMSWWEQHILEVHRYTDMNQLDCVIYLLKSRQFNMKTNTHQGVNNNHKNLKNDYNKLNTPCSHHSSLLVIHTQPKRTSYKWYIHLDSYHCLFGGNAFSISTITICVNTEISKAVMAKNFESVQSIASTIVLAPVILNHAFSYFIEAASMHCNLAIRHSPI